MSLPVLQVGDVIVFHTNFVDDTTVGKQYIVTTDKDGDLAIVDDANCYVWIYVPNHSTCTKDNWRSLFVANQTDFTITPATKRDNVSLLKAGDRIVFTSSQEEIDKWATAITEGKEYELYEECGQLRFKDDNGGAPVARFNDGDPGIRLKRLNWKVVAGKQTTVAVTNHTQCTHPNARIVDALPGFFNSPKCKYCPDCGQDV